MRCNRTPTLWAPLVYICLGDKFTPTTSLYPIPIYWRHPIYVYILATASLDVAPPHCLCVSSPQFSGAYTHKEKNAAIRGFTRRPNVATHIFAALSDSVALLLMRLILISPFVLNVFYGNFFFFFAFLSDKSQWKLGWGCKSRVFFFFSIFC